MSCHKKEPRSKQAIHYHPNKLPRLQDIISSSAVYAWERSGCSFLVCFFLPVNRRKCLRNDVLDIHTLVYGDDQPPATSTHSDKQLPCLPSTSTMSVSHLHLHPTPFSFSASHVSQYSSSSTRFFSSVVVVSKYFSRGNCRAGAFAGQC
jgi:hypothetical protein